MEDEKIQFCIKRKMIVSRMIKALKEADRVILLHLDENDPVYIEAFKELESSMNAAQSFLTENFPQITVSSQFH